jgi:GH24 family phage-related lysozyme (muramidase)
MPWDSKYFNFGVIRIEGDKVRVYRDQNNYTTISVGKTVTNAAWAGQELNVTMSDGKVRRYRDQNNYTTIG